MKNLWSMSRSMMTDEAAACMLASVLYIYEKIESGWKKANVRVVCYSAILKEGGWSYDDFQRCYLIPAFSQWFDGVVDQIWDANFKTGSS